MLLFIYFDQNLCWFDLSAKQKLNMLVEDILEA